VAAIAEVEDDGDGGADDDVWTLRLYIAGDSPKSRTALANLERLCDSHLKGKYKIEVIDLKTRPELAKADQILALPTLIRKIPEPMKRLIGDLSNAERALVALDLEAEPPSKRARPH
jgi:circadian clock protein KaiB